MMQDEKVRKLVAMYDTIAQAALAAPRLNSLILCFCGRVLQ